MGGTDPSGICPAPCPSGMGGADSPGICSMPSPPGMGAAAPSGIWPVPSVPFDGGAPGIWPDVPLPEGGKPIPPWFPWFISGPGMESVTVRYVLPAGWAGSIQPVIYRLPFPLSGASVTSVSVSPLSCSVLSSPKGAGGVPEGASIMGRVP